MNPLNTLILFAPFALSITFSGNENFTLSDRSPLQLPNFTCKQWDEFITAGNKEASRIEDVKSTLFYRGIEDSCAWKMWPYMFGIYDYKDSPTATGKKFKDLEVQYFNKKPSANSGSTGRTNLLTEQESEQFQLQKNSFPSQKQLIIDRLILHDPNLQFKGMEVVVTVLFKILKNEVLAYFSFLRMAETFKNRESWKSIVGVLGKPKVKEGSPKVTEDVLEAHRKMFFSNAKSESDIAGTANLWEILFLSGESQLFEKLIYYYKVEQGTWFNNRFGRKKLISSIIALRERWHGTQPNLHQKANVAGLNQNEQGSQNVDLSDSNLNRQDANVGAPKKNGLFPKIFSNRFRRQ